MGEHEPLMIDLSEMETTSDLFSVLSEAFDWTPSGKPSWESFFVHLAGGASVPRTVVLQGLDVVDDRLPDDAEALRSAFARYNALDDREVIEVDVTDDYEGPLHMVALDAVPGPDADTMAIGARVVSWVRTEDSEEAERSARAAVAELGWQVTAVDDVQPASLDHHRLHDPTRKFLKQAFVDGQVHVFHTYERDDEDDIEDFGYVSREERRTSTEERLEALGAPLEFALPYIESEDEAKLRDPQDVARRCLCLLAVSAVAEGVDRADIRKWLLAEDLWADCSPEEVAFLTASTLDKDEARQFSWRTEALWLLLWAIGDMADLPPPTHEVDDDALLALMPGIEAPTRAFVEAATMRSTREVLAMSDFLYCAHWLVREHSINPDTAVGRLNHDVIMERHHAVNWLTCYGDSDWDDVDTDT